MTPLRQFLSACLLCVVSALLLFWRLDAVPLIESTEARYAEVSREMVASGDYLYPRLHGIAHVTKPPLAYWLGAAGIKAFGPHDWSARLGCASISVVTTLLIFRTGSLLFGPGAGFLAALLLAFTPEFLALGRTVSADMPLTFTVVLAQLCLCHILFTPTRPRRYPFLFNVAMGFSFLTKGPVGLMVVLAPLLVFFAFHRRLVPWRRIFPWWGIIVFALVGLPWYVWITARTPGLLAYYLGNEVMGRTFTDVHGRAEPFGFLFSFLFGGFLPWTFLLPPALAAAASQEEVPPPPDRPKILYLCLQVVVPFAVFMLARSKQGSYVLPLFPPLALFVGWFLARHLRGDRPARLTRFASVCISVFLLAAAVAVFGLFRARSLELSLPGAFVLLCAAALGGASFLLSRRLAMLLGNCLSLAVLLSFTLVLVADVVRTRGRSSREAASIISSTGSPGSPVLAYGSLSESLPFYLNHPVLLVLEHPPTRWEPTAAWRARVLASDGEMTAFLSGKSDAFVVTPPKYLSHLSELFPGREDLLLHTPHKALVRVRALPP